MARIEIPAGDERESRRMWSIAPHLGEAVHEMSKAVYEKCTIAVREREAMRMRIAQLNQCHV